MLRFRKTLQFLNFNRTRLKNQMTPIRINLKLKLYQIPEKLICIIIVIGSNLKFYNLLKLYDFVSISRWILIVKQFFNARASWFMNFYSQF